MLVPVGLAQNFYEFNLKYGQGNYSFNSLNIVYLDNNMQKLLGGYVAEIVSFDDKVLNLTFFDIPLLVLYDQFDEETGEVTGGGQIILDEKEITLQLPYYKNAKEINIYDKDLIKMLTIDVSSFSKDISVKKEAELIKKIPEKMEDTIIKEEMEKGKNYNLYLAIVGILIIILIIAALLIKRKHNYT